LEQCKYSCERTASLQGLPPFLEVYFTRALREMSSNPTKGLIEMPENVSSGHKARCLYKMRRIDLLFKIDHLYIKHQH